MLSTTSFIESTNQDTSMKKIGIIDSGVGGLTILTQLIDQKVNADFYYISDEKNVPYGNKSQAFMLEQMKSMTLKLKKQDVDAILIACNTATAETINKLRNLFAIPFFGIEPYLNFINKEDVKNKEVGLILTEATYSSDRFKTLLNLADPNGSIKIFPLKNLASFIERLKYETFNKLESYISTEILPLKEHNLDILILGCTHYPIISNYLTRVLELEVVDPAQFVINQIVNSLGLKSDHLDKKKFNYNCDNSDNWIVIDISTLGFL